VGKVIMKRKSKSDSGDEKKLNDIKEGTKLELKIFNDTGEKIKLATVSEFQWVEDDKTAVIAAPISEGVIYPVHRNTLIDIYFIENVSMFYNSSLYKFTAEVIDRFRNDNIEMLKIKMQGDIQKIQRRQFFRFECTVPVKYRVIKTLNPLEYETNGFMETVTRDLSGGGICIKIMEEVPKGKYVQCELHLGEKRSVLFIGKVLRLTKYGVDEKYNYEIGIEFTKIKDSDRDAVVKFIFDEQRRLRKKGLI